MPSAAEIVAQAPRLATLPSVYLKVRRALDDPQISIMELARVVATDPAIAARLLQVVNSPFYGLGGRVHTISQALSILGMQQVHDLVVASCLATTFRGIRPAQIDMTLFWYGSVFRALAARRLARACRLIDAERPFIDALLSDVGHLVLYLQLPEAAMQARTLMRRMRIPLTQAEQQTVGCDYAEVGQALLGAWGLPVAMQEAVGAHAEPPAEGAHALAASIVHIAAFLACSGTDGELPFGPDIAPAAWRATGLDPAALPELQAAAAAEVADVMELFFPRRAAA